MKIHTRDGTKLYVKDQGSGRPVIMTHGWSLTADWWDHQAVALAQAGYRVVTYDRRGFGRSDQPWRGYDYDTFADDLADVMSELGIAADATLVGYSMGSGEVARYVSRHGGRGLVRAALVSPVAPRLLRATDNPQGFDPASFERQTTKLLADRYDFFRGYFKSMFGVGFLSRSASAATLEWCWTLANQAGLHPLAASRAAFGRADFRPDLASFDVPTLVIHGTADTDAPIDATARAAAAGIRDARLIEYEGATHALPITHKDRLTADLLGFLREA